MAQFYASAQGSRAEVHRLGTKKSGAVARVQGWNIGALAYADTLTDSDGNELDAVTLCLTGGSSDARERLSLGTFGEDETIESIAATLRTAADRLESRPDRRGWPRR